LHLFDLLDDRLVCSLSNSLRSNRGPRRERLWGVFMFGIKRQQTENASIKFDQLKVGDKLILNTANSEYHFKITNAVERRGILSGGQLGNEAHEAVLYCLTNSNLETLSDKQISVNEQAIFFLQTKVGLQRLLTSDITNLRLMRDHAIPTRSLSAHP
jgi:hypothetical protein